MKRFCIKCGLFFLPLILIFLPAVYHLESCRELDALSEMAEDNQNDGALIGLAYTDPMHLVKYKVLEKRQPTVIALGSSRVLSFRSFVFNDPSLFYNCGRSVGRVQDMKSFLSSYPGQKPKIILLGLDQDFFGIEDRDLDKPPRSYLSKETSYGERLIKGTKAFFDAVKEGEVEGGVTLTEASSYIGRNARLYSEGYRPDGSYIYGRRLRAIEGDEYSFSSSIKRINKRKGRFAAADKIHPGAVRELAAFIELCHTNEIHVVAFIPPYANRVFQRLEEERSQFPHVFDLRAKLHPIFNRHGFKLFDFSDLKSVGSNDYETYDGFHASETAYLKLIRIMADQDSVLSGVLSKPDIKNMLGALHSARQVIKEIEEPHPKLPTPINR
tara:strand:- start:31 stop:1182 length:1152 start_codon:yes stop_codon:yes gene_type:complete